MIDRLNIGLLWSGLAVLAAVVLFSPQNNSRYDQLSKRTQALQSRLEVIEVRSVEPVQKSSSTVQISSRLTALEQRVGHLSIQLARDPGAPAKHSEPDNDVLDRDLTDQTLLAEQLAQAGVDATGMTREDFRPQSVDVWDAGARLRDNFEQLPLADAGRVTDMLCHHSHCEISVQFEEARAAVEQEAFLMAWLASVDGACSFALKPVDFTTGQASATRQATILCN